MTFRRAQILAVCVAFLPALAPAGAASMYAVRDVCVAEDGASVVLVRRGMQVPLPDFASSKWCAESFSGRAKISFGADEAGSFLALDGPDKPGDTAWEVRSPCVPLVGNGRMFVLSFAVESKIRMRLQGGEKKWRSSIAWFAANGKRISDAPFTFAALGDSLAQLEGEIPQNASHCQVRIGTDTPNLVPGQRLVFRDIRLDVCGDRAHWARQGAFESDVRPGGRIAWRGATPPGTAVHFQYASADDPVAALSATMRGPDGTEATFFDAPFEAEGAWVRYRAVLLSTDGTATPRLHSVSVGAREDRVWRPGPDVRPPRVAVVGCSSTTNGHETFTVEVTDDSAFLPESFHAAVDGVDATARFVRDGCRYRLPAPPEGWANGLHRISVSVADCHGNSATNMRCLHVGASPSTPRVTLRDDGMTLVDGEPFFPIGLYSVREREFNGNNLDRAFAGLAAGGFNFAQSYEKMSLAYLDAAHRHGIRLWCAVREPDAFFMDVMRHHPAVLAWYLGDDTSDNTTPEELFERQSLVNAADPTRITCQADPVGPREFARVASRYADYVTGTDVFMPELYPVRGAAGDETDRTCVAKVIHDMLSVAADRRDHGEGRPRGCWPIIQYFKGWGNWGHFPTRAQLSAMTWAAVVHGANGVAWYTYGGNAKDGNEGVTSTPERWHAICELAGRLKGLSPVLVERTPIDQPAVSIVSGAAHDPFDRPSVSCLLKRHGGMATLVAVNAAPAPATARFGVAGGGAAKVLWESREVPFDANGLEDAFEPFAVHVYQWREPFVQNGLAARSPRLEPQMKGNPQ